jgi:hypothetical protein
VPAARRVEEGDLRARFEGGGRDGDDRGDAGAGDDRPVVAVRPDLGPEVAERRQHFEHVAGQELPVRVPREGALGDGADAEAQRAVLGEFARGGRERVGAAHFGAVGFDALEGEVLAGLEVERGPELGGHGEGDLDGVLGERPDAAHGELVPGRPVLAGLLQLDGHVQVPSSLGLRAGRRGPCRSPLRR